MYESAFGLQKRPFSTTPDAACVYFPGEVQELFQELLDRIGNHQGVAVLTGMAGTGKTLLCRKLIGKLAGRSRVAYLSSANFTSRRALLQAVLYELGQKYHGLDEQELRLELRTFLKSMSAPRSALVLIIDEAHLLNEKLIEELRLLANLVDEGTTPVRVILAGQPALEELLAQPSQAAFSQLIVFQRCLEPLTQQESRAYLAHRIAWAGGDLETIISDDALEAMVRASGGLPRCLNQLADHSLLLAFVHESRRVERSHVEDALADLKQLPLHWNEPLSQASVNCGEDEQIELPESVSLPLESAYSIEIGGDPPLSDSSTDDEVPGPLAHRAQILHPVAEQVFEPDSVEPEAKVSSMSFPRYDVSESNGGWPSAGGIVPLSAGSRRPVNLLHEEVVYDRYAQIDSGMPAGPLPVSGEQSAIESGTELAARPDLVLDDDVYPLMDEALAFEEPQRAAESVELNSFQAEAAPLEDLVQADVFDICLEVQQSILDQLSTVTDSTENPALPVYDAIEPESDGNGDGPSDGSLSSTPRIQHLDIPGSGQAAVPKPNYKLIFSTLRKKLGGRRK